MEHSPRKRACRLAAAALLAAQILDPSGAFSAEVRLYSQRHYDADKQILAKFSEATGIEVKTVQAGADELIARMASEKDAPQADLFLAVDAGALDRANAAGLLQPVDSEILEMRIPEDRRGPGGTWYPITMRARVIVYSRERVKPDEVPQTYADLADAKWRGRILVRSSSSMYNQSLLASIIAADGKSAALQWAQAVRRNMARPPQGSDRDQVRAIAQGIGDLALVNTYYLGLLETSEDAADRNARAAVGIVFPNQGEGQRGAHVNVSGAGVVKGAANAGNAIRLLEFLTSPEIQALYQDLTSEFAACPAVEPAPLQKAWGTFRPDTASLRELAGKHEEAVRIFDTVGWQ